jgi:16S rRNA (adenine1518-N6/adenine1519-N6)-dimethyltransferase
MAPRAKRRLGQHFLSDPRILGRIADAVAAGPDDTVLEIGPGPGGLTAALAARAGRVIAIEKDRELVPALRERFPEITVVEGDALELDWHALAAVATATARPGTTYKVAGNIPYNITSPLIDKALLPPRPAVIVFLVQKEVAERVTAAPGTAEYGALTVGVQSVANAERLFTVPAGAFYPKPKVDSAVLRLVPVDRPLVPDAERAGFRRLVVGLFGFRRKQLQRGLRELTGWDSERVAALLRGAELDRHARPEVLAPADFLRLHRGIVDAAVVGR